MGCRGAWTLPSCSGVWVAGGHGPIPWCVSCGWQGGAWTYTLVPRAVGGMGGVDLYLRAPGVGGMGGVDLQVARGVGARVCIGSQIQIQIQDMISDPDPDPIYTLISRSNVCYQIQIQYMLSYPDPDPIQCRLSDPYIAVWDWVGCMLTWMCIAHSDTHDTLDTHDMHGGDTWCGTCGG